MQRLRETLKGTAVYAETEKARTKRTTYLALLLLLLASYYYYSLSSEMWTWVFTSGDSGMWLAASSLWVPPQPFGNPLFVLLGHLVNALPGSIVGPLTYYGSVLPSAVTVSVTFLIVNRLTHRTGVAFVSAMVLLGSAVFTSQSTVISQYPLAVTFPVLAFWFYLRDRKTLSVAALGLGVATHVVNAVIAVLWFGVEWKQGRAREWIRLIPVFAIVGFAPYLLTLWELHRLDPQLLIGGPLSIELIGKYLTTISVAGSLAASSLPERLLDLLQFWAVSIGLAGLPLWIGLKRKHVKGYWLAVTVIGFISWYYLTSQDPTTWHYLPWAAPFAAILVGVGLPVLPRLAKVSVTVGALSLILATGVFLNAGTETRRNPVASELYEALQALPQNAAVVTDRAGWSAFAFFNVYATSRPDLLPVYLVPDALWFTDVSHRNYINWLREEHSIAATSGETLLNTVKKDRPMFTLDKSGGLRVAY